MAETTTTQTQKEPKQQPKKDKPGSYDHTDQHTAIYSMHGINASDNEIDRAWARLHDQGHYAGPAMSQPFTRDDGQTEVQHFLYAHATRDTSPDNVNKKVKFHFGPQVLEESGL